MPHGSQASIVPAQADTAVVRLDVYRALRAINSEARAATITPARPGGFETSIHACGGTYSLSIGGLVQDFDALDEAITWAARAQQPDRRLRIDYAGRHPVRWALERTKPDGTIEEELVCGRSYLIASQRHRRTEYLSNAGPDGG